MQVKLFEVRDHATCIVAIAIRPGAGDLIEEMVMGASPRAKIRTRLETRRFLLGVAGFSGNGHAILFGNLRGGAMHTDPYAWPPDARTMRAAHFMIERDWNGLEDGAVVDVRVELGERDAPVESDRLPPAGAP